ncbi:MAG: hypothetical protein ACRDTJ_23890 [Pseudonocardiaceae bacterium]
MSGRPCSPQRAAVPVQDVVRLAGRRAGAPRRGDPRQLCRWGLEEFTAAVRRGLPRWHGIRPTLRIVRAVFAALADPHGVTSHRTGALERAGLVLADWQHTTRRLADTEARMVAVLDSDSPPS